MPPLKETKDRIKSVNSSLQITSAMKLIMSYKYSSAVSYMRKVREYFEESLITSYALLYNLKNADLQLELPLMNIFSSSREKKTKKFVIVITSDKGLCGAYNSNVIKSVEGYLNTLQQEEKDYHIFCIGAKGYKHFSQVRNEQNISNAGVVFDIRMLNKYFVKDIVDKIQNIFKKSDFSELEIFYTHFINSFEREVRHENMFDWGNINVDAENDEDKVIRDMETDVDFEKYGRKIFDDYINLKVHGSLLDSIVSEYSSRMVAMDNASKNAEDLLQNLKLEANRKRQANVTQELSEIISGSESMQ